MFFNFFDFLFDLICCEFPFDLDYFESAVDLKCFDFLVDLNNFDIIFLILFFDYSDYKHIIFLQLNYTHLLLVNFYYYSDDVKFINYHIQLSCG